VSGDEKKKLLGTDHFLKQFFDRARHLLLYLENNFNYQYLLHQDFVVR
jgi:hypothetical protein